MGRTWLRAKQDIRRSSWGRFEIFALPHTPVYYRKWTLGHHKREDPFLKAGNHVSRTPSFDRIVLLEEADNKTSDLHVTAPVKGSSTPFSEAILPSLEAGENRHCFIFQKKNSSLLTLLSGWAPSPDISRRLWHSMQFSGIAGKADGSSSDRVRKARG